MILGLADAIGVDPAGVPPLYDYVDLDALNALFERHERAPDRDTLLSFQVDAWNVFVRSDGRIRVCNGTKLTDLEPVFEFQPDLINR